MLERAPVRVAFTGTEKIERKDQHNFADERTWYQSTSALVNLNKDLYTLMMEDILDQKEPLTERPRIFQTGLAGFAGYRAGPNLILVDFYGLSDPLMARIPPYVEDEWRPGHFPRIMPAGLYRSIQDGGNHIKDPDMKRYYEKLCILTQSPVLSISRFKEIIKFNLGMYNELIDKDFYLYPPPCDSRKKTSTTSK